MLPKDSDFTYIQTFTIFPSQLSDPLEEDQPIDEIVAQILFEREYDDDYNDSEDDEEDSGARFVIERSF